MIALDHQASLGSLSERSGRVATGGLERLVRSVPIRWRILSIAVLNCIAVRDSRRIAGSGAQMLSSAWTEVRQVRQSDMLLSLLGTESGRLQNLIHRYINEPRPEIFAEILLLREAVLGTLKTRGAADPMLAPVGAGA